MRATEAFEEGTTVAPPEGSGESELRTLVFAPLGQDGPLTCEFLLHAGMAAENCRNAGELCRKVDEGCGAILVAEEALDATSTSGLVEALLRQAPWSDVPIVIVSSDGRVGEERLRRLGIFGPTANVTLLERPFRPATLISTVDAGLRARRRQYQVRDLVHEVQQARDAAERASRAKDDFLAALSHELRTPLNPVLLLASEAAFDPKMPAAIRSDFEMIARNVELEAHLIDDLLDLTRITRGKLVLDLHRLDVHAVLQDALSAMQMELQDRILHLRLDLEASRFSVMADPVRLRQVIWNILKNAVKFTPDHGSIAITSRNPSDADRLIIEITDTGIGMTSSEIAVAFDAFAQGEHADRESRQRFGGLGLGLAISRMLLDLHAGGIRAESAGRGHGSTFVIDLPLAAPPERDVARAGLNVAHAGPDTARTPATPPRPKSVLLVEDHEPTRSSLTRLLHRRGYDVTAASSLAEAKAAARARPFDVLISDLGLPDGNGCELLTTLPRHFVRSIALSGYGMESDIARSKHAGFSAHLVKPLTTQTLDRALNELFEARNAERVATG
jgi:signal transduction histidine kinase/ActR/RegA family two-component response regulator